MAKVMEFDFDDVDIEEVEISTIPSVKIHFNPNDMVNPWIELQRDEVIAICHALGIHDL